jgi:dipeptidyl aminopeptidase/acylaminoacyl peptidase
MALACEDKVVRIYDWPSGKERTVLEGHNERIWMAAFCPDGKLLASCTGEYSQPENPAELRLWDLTTGRKKTTLEGHKGLVFSVTFSPDGGTLISTGWDGTVRLWDVAQEKERAAVTDHQGPVRMAAYAPDTKSFATAGFDGTVRFWDAATARPLKTIVAHESGVQCVAFSPDGRYLATCDRPTGAPGNGTIKLWDVPSGEELAQYQGIKGPVLSLAFSPEGAMLAASGGSFAQSGDVKLFEVASGLVRASFDGHKEWVECVRFSPNGRVLVSAGGFTRGQPGEVRAWPIPPLHLPPASGGDKEGGKPDRLTGERLHALWGKLADRDAAAAYQAILELSAVPGDAVPFLKDSLRPVEPVDPKRIAKLIEDLDNDAFQARERASQELEQIADIARPSLQKAHAEPKSAEMRKRTETLLKFTLSSPEQLRRLRAVEVLGASANPAAKQLLQELAKGAPGARLTEQARAALARLDRPGKVP